MMEEGVIDIPVWLVLLGCLFFGAIGGAVSSIALGKRRKP